MEPKYKDGGGGNHLQVFSLCLHAHIYSVMVHCK